ncbi:MAG: penicillin acylase family protein [Myxococcales bacterium]|nr:penicillin acylase family protein [Myxococcales bacterium]
MPGLSESETSSESSRVPLTQVLDGNGLHRRVEVIRDHFGLAHIYAKNADDAAFAQGFVLAHDRLPQMDLLRRFGSGTLAELYGGLDPTIIDQDLQLRLHRMRPLAEQSLAELQASSDRTDQAIVRTLQRYADGVNAYVRTLRETDRFSIDPQILAVWRPEAFAPWTPVDSLVLARFQAFSLSFSVINELTITELYQRLRQAYDPPGRPPEMAARRNIARDLLRLAPVGQDSPLDGFPNVSYDTGSRSDGGHRFPRRNGAASLVAPPSGSQRPNVPLELLSAVSNSLPSGLRTGPLGAPGAASLMAPWAGSNTWAVSPRKAGGKALLAADQHLQLTNPTIFYPLHVSIEHDTEALGITFPGIPGVILGTNGDVAWSSTVAYFDVNDIYMEQVAPCGAGSCVAFQGGQVPVETWNETIKIGVLGQIVDQRTVTYERVPHHGPILPIIRDGNVVPRTGPAALSVRFTGYSPSYEFRAIWNLMRARDVHQAFRSLRDFTFGGQNWTMIDNRGNIAWTTNVEIPQRAANATTWNAATNPNGNAPFFVLPGDGSAEWEGRMSSRYVPHSINPRSGYLANANSDPVGATFDDDALNEDLVDGRPLYAGVGYAPGLRLERIASLLEGAMTRGRVTLTDFAAIQHDSKSTVGGKLARGLADALAFVADPTGAPADVAAYVATLSDDQRSALTQARGLLVNWSTATPPAVAADASASEISDSAATSLFNTWMHFFIKSTLDDELTLAGFDRSQLADSRLVRVVYAMLEEPGTLVQSQSSQQPVLCDRLGVGGPDDSCTKMQLVALSQALDHLASADGYGSADPTTWRWGAKHRSVIASMLPNPGLNLPDASDGPAMRGGFPRAGDTFVINRADTGWGDLDFSQSADGAVQRFLAEAEHGRKIKVKWQIPGGTIFDTRSPHYRDLLDNSYRPEQHFNAPFERRDVIATGEQRWLFQ